MFLKNIIKPTEEVEVGGRVADELNEGFPHPLAK